MEHEEGEIIEPKDEKFEEIAEERIQKIEQIRVRKFK